MKQSSLLYHLQNHRKQLPFPEKILTAFTARKTFQCLKPGHRYGRINYTIMILCISISKITVLRSDHSVSGPYATGPVTGFEINTYTSVCMSFTSPKYFLVVVIVYIQHKFLFLLKTWKA